MLPALTVVFFGALVYLYPETFLEREYDQSSWARAALLLTAYAWLMCFGTMGLFRWLASRERARVRYLSDASYWLYITHLPLVLLMQDWLVKVEMSPHLKFLLICLAAPAILLIVYQLAVRHSIIGTMLNGPRARGPSQPRPPLEAYPNTRS